MSSRDHAHAASDGQGDPTLADIDFDDGRSPDDTPWKRFRDEAPTYDGWGERYLMTWCVRTATYDVGCIDGEWAVGEAIKGHPDDLWRWLDVNPERHMQPRPCTCHPDDATTPCAQRFAASECAAVRDREGHGTERLLNASQIPGMPPNPNQPEGREP